MKKVDFKSLERDCQRSIAARLQPRDLFRLVSTCKDLGFLAENVRISSHCRGILWSCGSRWAFHTTSSFVQNEAG